MRYPDLRRRGALVVVAVLVVVALGGCGTSAPSAIAGCADPRYAIPRLAGLVEGANDVHVDVYDAEGHRTRPGRDWLTGTPSFSPDGRDVAVTWYESTGEGRNTRIAVLATDGGRRRMIAGTDRGTYPAWSPDARTIAYAHDADDGERNELRLVDATTGAQNRSIVNLPQHGHRLASTTWSPDGGRLAFIDADLFSGPTTIWVVDRDGANLVRVAQFPFPAGFDLVRWWSDGRSLLLSGSSLARVDLATRTFRPIAATPVLATPASVPDAIVYLRPARGVSMDTAELAHARVEETELVDVGAVPNVRRQEFTPQGEGLAVTCLD